MIKKLSLTLFLLIMALVIFLGSPLGLSSAVWLSQKYAPIEITGAQGSLLHRLSIQDLHAKMPHQDIRAEQITLRWSPWHLWRGLLDVRELHIHSLILTAHQTTEATPPAAHPTGASHFPLPLIRIAQANIDHLKIYGDPQKLWLSGSLSFSLQDTHHFHIDTDLEGPMGQLQLHGYRQKQWDLNWAVKLHDLEHAFPRLSGNLTGQGKIQGASKKPRFTGQIEGTDLAYNYWRLGLLHTNWSIDTQDHQQDSFIHLKLEELDNGAKNLVQSASWEARGTLAHQSSRLEAKTSLGLLQIHTQGQIQIAPFSAEQQLTKFSLSLPESEHWQLKKPFVVSINSQRLYLSSACWTGRAPDRLCIQAQQEPSTHWLFELHTWLDLAHYAKLMPTDVALNGQIQADASLAGEANQLQKLQVQIQGHSLQEHVENSILIFPIFNLHLNLTAPKTLEFTQVLQNNRGDQLDTQWVLNSPTPLSFPIDKNSKLRGEMRLQVSDLSWLNPLLPTLFSLHGPARVEATLQGTLEKPHLTLNSDLKKAHVKLPDVGLTLSNLSLTAKTQHTILNYALHLDSNGVPLDLKGSADLENWSFNGQSLISGQNIPVISTLSFNVLASPRLIIQIQRPSIRVFGKVDINKAFISPRDFDTSVSLPRADIIYVHAPQPEAPYWQTHLNVDVSLGNAVKVDSRGLTGRLTGRVNLQQKTNTPLTANGKIHLEDGQFHSHGHQLTLSSAIVNYQNAPVTNPYFSVTATRSFDNYSTSGISMLGVDNLTVGMTIIGTPQRQKFLFFSHPVTLSQGDILSYLLLGHGVSAGSATDIGILLQGLGSSSSGGLLSSVSKIQESLGLAEFGIQSQTSMDLQGNPIDSQSVFVVGKYLTPQIYLRYSRDLIDATNTIVLRYLITPEWAVQTDSSTAGSGGDVIYSFYRP